MSDSIETVIPEAHPTLAQVRRAAHRLYDGPWWDPRMIIVCDDPRLVRHEDGDRSGTWVDVSVFVPDSVAREAKP